MKTKIMFVGLDVDDKAFHVGGFVPESGEILEFSCKPTAAMLHQKLGKYEQLGYSLRICYESCHLGFSLCRDLVAKGWECTVISSASIPRPAGAQVKTDRLDANKLARYFANGLLTAVHVPSSAREAERDLIRTRRFLQEQTTDIKRYILSLCRRAGLDYRKTSGEGPQSHYWSARHRQWIQGAIGHIEEPSWKINLSTLLLNLQQLEEQVRFYDLEVEKLSTQPHYEQAVKALGCFRGLSTLSSMTILAELGTIARFSHPRQLVSYAGMDIAEYSSGGKERKRGITKMGSSHLRRTLIESCQYAGARVALSKPLRKRREYSPSLETIQIADRCMKRLYQRSEHLSRRGKPKNKIKVACARELTGFIWESLRSIGF